MNRTQRFSVLFMWAHVDTPHMGILIALFLTDMLEFAKFQRVKTKAY